MSDNLMIKTKLTSGSNMSSVDENKSDEDTNKIPAFGWFFLVSEEDKKKRLAEEKEKRHEEERRKESYMIATIKQMRNKIIDRNLTATITISSITGVITTEYSLDVDPSTLSEDEKILSSDALSRDEQADEDRNALTITDTILNSLERRSKVWEGIAFAEDLTLTRGATVGVTVPFLKMLTLEFTFEISATVKSLLAARKLYEHNLAIEKKRQKFLSAYTPIMHTGSVKTSKSVLHPIIETSSVADSGSKDTVDDSNDGDNDGINVSTQSSTVRYNKHRITNRDDLETTPVFGNGCEICALCVLCWA